MTLTIIIFLLRSMPQSSFRSPKMRLFRYWKMFRKFCFKSMIIKENKKCSAKIFLGSFLNDWSHIYRYLFKRLKKPMLSYRAHGILAKSSLIWKPISAADRPIPPASGTQDNKNDRSLVGLCALCYWLFYTLAMAEVISQTVRYFWFVPTVIFHELSHAAHSKAVKDSKKIQTWQTRSWQNFQQLFCAE